MGNIEKSNPKSLSEIKNFRNRHFFISIISDDNYDRYSQIYMCYIYLNCLYYYAAKQIVL